MPPEAKSLPFKPLEKKHVVRLILAFPSAVAGFWLVGLFTIKPHRHSGNGNLGLLVMPPVAFVYVLFLLAAGAVLVRWLANRSERFLLALIVLAAAMLALCCWMEIAFIERLIDRLGGNATVPDSRIYRYRTLNQYTNTFYFNRWTFSIGFLSALIGCTGGTLFSRLYAGRKNKNG
ncbi:hypothetical protein [Paenibacillus sp. MBLB4367]|uniref:hypothetical protein n=1 Tax=Paenibacillus sp. MBLB4367 TaxID=3384767 RepID=UPI00390809B1